MSARKILLPAVMALQLLACSSDGGGPNLGPIGVATVTIAPLMPSLDVGKSLQMTATARDLSGNPLAGRIVTWSSADTKIATVTGAGVVTGVAAGKVRITATSERKEGATDVTVNAGAGAPKPVVSVAIEPVSAVVAEGQTQQFSALARDLNGGEIAARGVQWSIDESGIALVDGAGLVTALRPGLAALSARVDGKSATGSLRVEADHGFELVYERAEPNGTELYRLDIRDPAAVAMPVLVPARQASGAAVSPDGRKLAFVVGSSMDTAIYVADRDGGNATRLTLTAGENDQPTFSPDGLRLAFRRRAPGSDADIWIMDASDGGNARNLTADLGATNQSAPAFSPDLGGGVLRIAFAHSVAGESHIFSMRADGSDKQQVTLQSGVYDDQPSWSPDGTRIVFARSGDGTFGELYVVSAAGGGGGPLMALTGPLAGPQFAPAFSPDGRLVAFASRHVGDQFQIYTVWSDGTRLAQRTRAAAEHANPVWLAPATMP